MNSHTFFFVFFFAFATVIGATARELPFTVEKVGDLDTRGITDGRPTEGSGKHAVWLGDRNGDGIPEYFVTTKKGGTSTMFCSNAETGKWDFTSHWYLPSYSVIALDTKGDERPEYLIKTSKYAKGNHTIEDFADFVPDLGKSYTTVLRIPEDPCKDPLEVAMTFDRAVPIMQGCVDLNGDGYKDLLVTHHLEKSKYVARYYKGKDDSIDGRPFEEVHQWASTGQGTSMDPALKGPKARWGDVQFIKDGPARLFAVGTEGTSNHVIYWDYDPSTDTFDTDATILDVSAAEYAIDNKLRLVSVRALPGAVMFAGQDGAYFFKYNKIDDSYQNMPVPGIWSPNATEYSDFWCYNSGKNDNKMVFVVLRKRFGNKPAVMEFRTFDPMGAGISDILAEVPVMPKAQRITVLRTDFTYNVMLDAMQLIISGKNGADIYDVVYDQVAPTTASPTPPGYVLTDSPTTSAVPTYAPTSITDGILTDIPTTSESPTESPTFPLQDPLTGITISNFVHTSDTGEPLCEDLPGSTRFNVLFGEGDDQVTGEADDKLRKQCSFMNGMGKTQLKKFCNANARIRKSDQETLDKGTIVKVYSLCPNICQACSDTCVDENRLFTVGPKPNKKCPFMHDMAKATQERFCRNKVVTLAKGDIALRDQCPKTCGLLGYGKCASFL